MNTSRQEAEKAEAEKERKAAIQDRLEGNKEIREQSLKAEGQVSKV